MWILCPFDGGREGDVVNGEACNWVAWKGSEFASSLGRECSDKEMARGRYSFGF